MKKAIKIIRRILILIIIVIVVLVIAWHLVGVLVMFLLVKDINRPPDPESVQKKYAAMLPIKSSGRDVIFFTQGVWAGDYKPMIGICSSLNKCDFGEFSLNMFEEYRPIRVSLLEDRFIQLEQKSYKGLMNLTTLTQIQSNAVIENKLEFIGCLSRSISELRWTFGQENCEK